MRFERHAAERLTGLRSAEMNNRAAGTLLKKVMIESDDSVNFGNGEVQLFRDERHRVLGDEGQRFLHRVKNRYQRTRKFLQPRTGIENRRTFVSGEAGRLLEFDWDDSPRRCVTHDA